MPSQALIRDNLSRAKRAFSSSRCEMIKPLRGGSLLTASLALSTLHGGQMNGSTSQTHLISCRHVVDATGRRPAWFKRSTPTGFALRERMPCR